MYYIFLSMISSITGSLIVLLLAAIAARPNIRSFCNTPSTVLMKITILEIKPMLKFPPKMLNRSSTIVIAFGINPIIALTRENARLITRAFTTDFFSHSSVSQINT